MLIYDSDTGLFFAGWDWHAKVYANDAAPPSWTQNLDTAIISTGLKKLQEIVKRLGGGARIVSETRARQIVAMREYNKQKGAIE